MLRELEQRTLKVECQACFRSLNFYDSYFCPVCQGTGVVEVQTQKEALLPKGKSIGYELCLERL